MRVVVNNIHLKYHFFFYLKILLPNTIFECFNYFSFLRVYLICKKIACKSITQVLDDAEEVEGKQKQI